MLSGALEALIFFYHIFTLALASHITIALTFTLQPPSLPPCREISALLHAQTAVAASGGAGAMDPQNKAQQFAFPLFRRIQAIALEGANVESLFDWE